MRDLDVSKFIFTLRQRFKQSEWCCCISAHINPLITLDNRYGFFKRAFFLLIIIKPTHAIYSPLISPLSAYMPLANSSRFLTVISNPTSVIIFKYGNIADVMA